MGAILEANQRRATNQARQLRLFAAVDNRGGATDRFFPPLWAAVENANCARGSRAFSCRGANTMGVISEHLSDLQTVVVTLLYLVPALAAVLAVAVWPFRDDKTDRGGFQ